MRYYLVVGEKSGDLHAANLMKAILDQDLEAQFRFWGGDDMKAVGGEMVKHYRDFAVMGLGEVIKKLPALAKQIRLCAEDVIEQKPDVVIFVDFAGFNLRVASKIKSAGIRTYYYISPKVWAWNQSRAKKIKKLIDRMFVIMTFEKAFYAAYDYEVDYVGNPIFDSVSSFEAKPGFLESHGLSLEKPLLALLPGSRAQEVSRILPPMVEAALRFRQEFPDYQIVVAGVDNLDEQLYEPAHRQSLPVFLNKTYDILANARLAIVTSGTATLETALMKVPQVVAYKTSWLTYWAAKLMLKIPYISLVNLVAEKLLAEELIQNECSGEGLSQALMRLEKNYAHSKADCDGVYEKVKTEGAAIKAARLIVESLSKH